MTVEAIEDSRLKGGQLTIDGKTFGKQMTDVTVTPSENTEGDDLETLTGATVTADETTSWTLDLGWVQDFDDPAGFVNFARQTKGTEVPFTWVPNAAGAPTIAGTVKVRAVPIGGAVNQRLTGSKGWPITGEPDVTYPAP